MTREQVISDLLACLRSIGPAQGFAIEPAAVLRGIHLAQELNELPALSLMNQRVDSTPLTTATAQRVLTFHLWGVARAVGEDYSQLDALAAAAVAALLRPELNPHWLSTSPGRLELFEGGAGEPLGLFDLELEVTYEAELAVL